MIVVVRIQSQTDSPMLWDEVVSRKEQLQGILGGNGKILYISKRHNCNEASIFMHVANTAALGDFIAGHLAKIRGVDAVWLLNMLKPAFFASPPDVDEMERYTVTLKADPKKLTGIYDNLFSLELPPDTHMTYLAYTFHLFGDCLQFSLVTRNGAKLQEYIKNTVGSMPGVLHTTTRKIEKTALFVRHGEWKKYISQTTGVNWNDKYTMERLWK